MNTETSNLNELREQYLNLTPKMRQTLKDLADLKCFIKNIKEKPQALLINDPGLTVEKLGRMRKKIERRIENINAELILIRWRV